MRTTLALFILCSSVSQASPIASCVLNMSAAASVKARSLEHTPDNSPYLMLGDEDTAVIMVHGFIASPWEVQELAQFIHDQGYTVYSPLIPGFGASPKIANQSHAVDWRTTLKDAVQVLQPCYSKISIFGFSLGGGLVSDFLLDPALSIDGTYGDVKITSAVIIAPYYKPEAFGASQINWFFSLFTDDFDISTLHFLTGHRDLKAILAHPTHYLQAMPLIAVDEIIQFGENIRSLPPSLKSNVPVLFSYSTGDRTVDTEVAQEFVTEHFPNHTKLVLGEDADVPHQALLPEVNPHYLELYQGIVEFLRKAN